MTSGAGRLVSVTLVGLLALVLLGSHHSAGRPIDAAAFAASPHQTARRAPRHTTAFVAAARAIRQEFGAGRAAACMFSVAGRETGYTYSRRAVNWHDHHADGSRGSFGLFQIGAVHRSAGERVRHFARRMYGLAANVHEAHLLYRERGLQPWGGSC